MKSHEASQELKHTDDCYFRAKDGINLFVYNFRPGESYTAVIVVISGITGINHHAERDLIEAISNNEHRVVVMHPRGTGYSEGARGDIADINLVVDDYRQLIMNDEDYISGMHPVYLYGHSMAAAVLLAAADVLRKISGAILINPPFIQKKAKGMTPGISDYVKYFWHMLFAKHTPIVNMAGNPSLIENEEDKRESERRLNDPLLVKYFSMHYMTEAKKLMNAMLRYSKQADYPLLLIYGAKDSIAEKAGCDLIYENWKCESKAYKIIDNGAHGKSTALPACRIISEWIKGVERDKANASGVNIRMPPP